MKQKARISRLRRLLMAQHVVYPPFVVSVCDDAGNITRVYEIHMRFA